LPPDILTESPKGLTAFSAALSSDEPVLLEALRRRSYQRTLQGRMVSGAHQGRLLSLLSSLVRPAKVLEIGTFTGYSALCLAEGLAAGGVVETIELNDELFSIQAEFWGRSEFSGQIVLRPGDALEVLDGMNAVVKEGFDLVFIDADKANYPAYVEHAHRLMRKGGLMILDNMWRDGTAQPGLPIEAYPCKEAQILAALNLQMKNDPRWEVVVLPLRDGLSLCRKI
jgi:caffeoyl-CoA O-methyltransferase